MAKLKIQKNHEDEILNKNSNNNFNSISSNPKIKKDLPIIRLDDICKTYRMGDSVINAVCDASLTINKGEFVAIVGPSGSGKCVSGETELLKGDGSLVKIKDIEDKKDIEILAFDKKLGKIKSFNISKFYKRDVNLLLEIETTGGRKIVVTEEHPFFTINKHGIYEIPANDLREN